MPTFVVEVEDLVRKFDGFIAVDHIRFPVEKGEIFGFLGPNGGGKTTLFKILTTAYPCRAGEVEMMGLDLASYPGEVRKKIGVVFRDLTYDIPAGATKLVVRFEANCTFWNEIMGLDNIRITSGDIGGAGSRVLTLDVSDVTAATAIDFAVVIH